MAVRLAEELTGKEITPAPSGTFTDTDSPYARKAYAAGIPARLTATTFGPNGTCTIQQAPAGSGVDDTSLDNAKGGYRSGSTYLPVVEPFTGETCYISGGKLKPIRD